MTRTRSFSESISTGSRRGSQAYGKVVDFPGEYFPQLGSPDPKESSKEVAKRINLQKKQSTEAMKQVWGKKIARQIARKKGIKLTATLLKKWIKKVIPWIGVGMLLDDLIKRGMKELKSDKQAESNPRVPQGNNYHSTVGWY